ncbi:MAG: hypothetical protein ABJO27_24835 [Pseudoruegeria sp.]
MNTVNLNMSTTTQTSAPSHTLLNRSAWTLRWRDRRQSKELAEQICSNADAASHADPSHIGLALRTLAWHLNWTGRSHDSIALAQKADRALIEAHSQTARIDICTTLSSLFLSQEKPKQAHQCHEIAISLLSEQTPDDTHACHLASHAILLFSENNRNGALDKLYEARTRAHGPEVALIQTYIANAYCQGQNTDLALEAAEFAHALARHHRNEVVQPYIQNVLGRSWLQSQNLKVAETALRKGMRLANHDGDQRAKCHLLQSQGLLALKQGRNSLALRRLKQGKRLAVSLNYPQWQIQFLKLLGSEHERLGDDRSAMLAYKEILRIKRLLCD